MELLNHVESDDINPARIKRIYDIWTKRVGSMKESPLVETKKRELRRKTCTKSEQGVQKKERYTMSTSFKLEKFVLSLESILLYLTQGHVEEANLAAMRLKQNRHFESHPISNMLTALTFYEKWCSKIPRKLQWKKSLCLPFIN